MNVPCAYRDAGVPGDLLNRERVRPTLSQSRQHGVPKRIESERLHFRHLLRPCGPKVKVENTEEQPAKPGFFRNPSKDGDLLAYFGLSWWGEVDPMLGEDGRLSPKRAERLLLRLKEQEYVFELELMKLPGDEQQHLRSRYTLLKNFLQQAIARCTGFEYGS